MAEMLDMAEMYYEKDEKPWKGVIRSGYDEGVDDNEKPEETLETIGKLFKHLKYKQDKIDVDEA